MPTTHCERAPRRVSRVRGLYLPRPVGEEVVVVAARPPLVEGAAGAEADLQTVAAEEAVVVQSEPRSACRAAGAAGARQESVPVVEVPGQEVRRMCAVPGLAGLVVVRPAAVSGEAEAAERQVPQAHAKGERAAAKASCVRVVPAVVDDHASAGVGAQAQREGRVGVMATTL